MVPSVEISVAVLVIPLLVKGASYPFFLERHALQMYVLIIIIITIMLIHRYSFSNTHNLRSYLCNDYFPVTM